MSLLQMSISGGIMILAVIVIRALAINHLPQKTFTALWGIVLLRLLVPFSVPSTFSAYSFIHNYIFVTQGVEGVKPANIFPGVPVALPTASSVLQRQAAMRISPYEIIWGIGTIMCALFFAISYVKCCRAFRESLPIILMPKSTKWEDTRQMEYILEHEFVHVRRFDAAVKVHLTAALCIHWFNPLVWATYVLFNRDIELSCDEAVVYTFGDTIKSAYANTLISMEEKKISLTPLCSNFCNNPIEERITAIMKIKKTSLTALLTAFFLVGSITTVFATSASQSSDHNNISTETGTVMSRKVSDDSPDQYSIDEGITWISEDEYHTMYPQDDIVWWTYDEYKAWVDEQKVELPKLIGTDNKYLKDGIWVRFTQRSVEESIRRYKNILEEIKNGAMLSKTVNDRDSITMIIIPPKDGDIGVSYGVSIAAENGGI